MDVVVQFIYSRGLTPQEAALAESDTHVNSQAYNASASLSEANAQQLESYYLPHTRRLLRDVLPHLQAQGVEVFGFTSVPWNTKV